MALKIIGAGFGGTGTMSAYTALNQLGLRCYHMFEVIENKANKGHLDFWDSVASAPAGAPHDWNRVFAGYAAAVDKIPRLASGVNCWRPIPRRRCC